VIVSPDNPFVKVKVGGKHIHILNFYNAIQLKGIDVEVISFKKNISKKNPLAILSYAKFKLVGSKIPFNQKQNLRYYFLMKTIEEDLAKQIKKLVKKNKENDLFFIAEDVIAANAIKRAGIDLNNTFSVIHGYFTYEAVDIGSIVDDDEDLKFYYDYERKAYSNCSKIITVDSAIKDYLTNNMGVSLNKIKVVYNSINIEEFNVELNEKEKFKQNFFDELTIINAKNLILIARRLVNKNGVYFGVESMSNLREISEEVYKNTHMVVCGDGPELKTINQLISSENLNSNVHLLGQVDHNKIKNIYKAADVVIVPSIYTETKFAEATSLAALEAMASRSSVIVSNVGGLKEIVKNENTGFVVEDKSSKQIAETLKKIFDLNQKEKNEAILRQAHDYVIKEHDYINHTEKILSFFSIIK